MCLATRLDSAHVRATSTCITEREGDRERVRESETEEFHTSTASDGFGNFCIVFVAICIAAGTRFELEHRRLHRMLTAWQLVDPGSCR